MPKTISDLSGGGGVKEVRERVFLRALLQGVVWKEINKRIFEDKMRNVWAVVDFVLCEVGS